MNIILESKSKIGILTGILSNIHRFADDINLVLTNEKLYVQGMDSSHVCIYEICLKPEWFQSYDVKKPVTIGLKSSVMCLIFGLRQENQSIHMELEKNMDKFDISFVNNPNSQDETPREFSIPIMDIDQEFMDIPDSEYDVSFQINSKVFSDIICPLIKFGDDVEFKLSDNIVTLTTDGIINGSITATLLNTSDNIQTIEKYKNDKSCQFRISLSLKYMVMFCSFHKIRKYVKLYITKDIPLRMEYSLEDDDPSQYMRLYLVPKIDD